MSRLRLTRRIYEVVEEGRRNRGKPYTRSLDGVKKSRKARSVELREANVMGNARLQ